MKCPHCGSKNVTPIEGSMAAWTDTTHVCKDCGKSFKKEEKRG